MDNTSTNVCLDTVITSKWDKQFGSGEENEEKSRAMNQTDIVGRKK